MCNFVLPLDELTFDVQISGREFSNLKIVSNYGSRYKEVQYFFSFLSSPCLLFIFTAWAVACNRRKHLTRREFTTVAYLDSCKPKSSWENRVEGFLCGSGMGWGCTDPLQLFSCAVTLQSCIQMFPLTLHHLGTL